MPGRILVNFLPSDDQVSVRSQDQDDNISIVASVLSEVNNNQDSQSVYNQHDYSVVGEGAPGFSDPVLWNRFLNKLADKLNIECDASTQEVDKPYTFHVSS